jgi:hypothetical protein
MNFTHPGHSFIHSFIHSFWFPQTLPPPSPKKLNTPTFFIEKNPTPLKGSKSDLSQKNPEYAHGSTQKRTWDENTSRKKITINATTVAAKKSILK